MIRLNRVCGQVRTAAIYGKVEGRNPAYSVKCRIGAAMVWDAEERGVLKPGMELVEPTSGNTGIALAFVCAARGYRLTLTMPETMSLERRRVLAAFGAHLELTPGDQGMPGAIARAHEMVDADPDRYFMPMQFANPANPAIHERTTGPEIWRQVEGRLDAMVIGVGSGGTFTGVARYLKRQNPEIHCVAVETNGSVLQGGEPGPHEVEGIGTSFIPDVLDMDLVDEIIMVHDDECFATAKELAAGEGLLVAGSSGGNVNAALQVARRLGPEGRVVTMLCDSAERYLSKGRLGGPPA